MPETALDLLLEVRRRINHPSRWIRDNVPNGAGIRAKGGLTHVSLDNPDANCYTLLGSILYSLRSSKDYRKAKRLHEELCDLIHEEILEITKEEKDNRAYAISKFNRLSSHRTIMALLTSVEHKLRSPVRTTKQVLEALLDVLILDTSWSNTGMFYDSLHHPCGVADAVTFSLLGAITKITQNINLQNSTLAALEHALICQDIDASIGHYAYECSHLDILILINQSLYFLNGGSNGN